MLIQNLRKAITNSIPKKKSRNYFPRMKNSVIAPSTPLGMSHQKPMKRTIIRKHKIKKHKRKDLVFNKLVSYLISDSYMYNPLVSSQPTFDFPPPKHIITSPGIKEDVALPIKGGRNKKLIQKVVDFLVADCYLYSPLITNKHVSSGHSKTLRGSESTETQGGRMQHMAHEGGDISGKIRATPVVMKTVAYRESVKHMVHPNYRTNPNQGA